MFNIGFGELLLLGLIALIFIPPKDLPRMAQMVGRFLNDLKRSGEEAFGSFVEIQRKSDDLVGKAESEIRDMASRVLMGTEKKPESETKPTPAAVPPSGDENAKG